MRVPLDYFRERAFENDPEVMGEYELACNLQDIVWEYQRMPRVECPECGGPGGHTEGGRYVVCTTCQGMGELIDA